MTGVVLCSDEPILGEGLANDMAAVTSFSLIARCSQTEELHTQIELLQPDILLVDLAAGITFGTLSALHAAAPDARVILWVHTISTEMALQAMSLGIRGILRKTHPTETLIRCLTRVQEGDLWFEKELTDNFRSARRYSLTRREGQLVGLLSEGLKNKELATALDISEGTVKVYLSRLFQKLGVKDRFELAVYGMKNLAANGGSFEGAGRRGRKGSAPTWQPPRSFFVEKLLPQSPRSEGRELGQFS